MEKYKIENRKLTRYLEEINLNVIKLNEQIERLIDTREDKTTKLRHIQPGRLRQLFAASNHSIPAPNDPKISPNRL